jgi:hypothetical protein
MERLAKALRVSYREVVFAQSETLGKPLGGEGSKLERLLPAEAAYLTDEEISAIRTMIISMGAGRAPATDPGNGKAAKPAAKAAKKAVRSPRARG